MKFLRHIFCLALIVLAALSLASSKALAQRESGAEVLQRLSSYLFDSREVKFNARITVAKETALNHGLFFACTEWGYFSLAGISEYQYDKENIYLYYYGTNEYTIQKRKESSSNIFENPFAFLSKPENLTVSDPSLEILDGKRVKVLTVTPAKGGKQSFQSAKVYLKENLQTPQLVKIDIYTANGGKFQLTVTSISQRLSAEQASAYKIDLSAHKGVIINDLR